MFRATTPEYLMILGAPDVVPHQDLVNPAFDPPYDDPDGFAWGDLPYACDEPYSRDIAKFKGPTRVVGRLPDLTGASEPSYLVRLLGFAEKYRSREVADYEAYFGLSAEVWRKSTRMSLFNIFGGSSKLELSPPGRPSVVGQASCAARPFHQLPRRSERSEVLRPEGEFEADPRAHQRRHQGQDQAGDRRLGRVLLRCRAL